MRNIFAGGDLSEQEIAGFFEVPAELDDLTYMGELEQFTNACTPEEAEFVLDALTKPFRPNFSSVNQS